jgi:hypothetical protein
MSQHKHHKLIKRYAEIAGITDEPWKFVRWRTDLSSVWSTGENGEIPVWSIDIEYEILDPYAELKQAFKNGHDINVDVANINDRMHVGCGLIPDSFWTHELDKYEILLLDKPKKMVKRWNWANKKYESGSYFMSTLMTKKEAKKHFKDYFFCGKIKGTKVEVEE